MSNKIRTIDTFNRHARCIDMSERLHGKNAFCQITEWSNGEGWDVEFSTSLGRQMFSLDLSMLDHLNHLLSAQRNYDQEVEDV